MTNRFVTAMTAAALVGACDGGGVDLPEPASIERIAETDNQLAAAGDRLVRPLAVRVLASDGATPVPRAEVAWVLASGAGALLSDSVTVTDGTGEAQVSVTLGPEEGSYGIRATLVAKSSETVTLTAVATTPPRIAAVEPAMFTGGDTITLRGTGLHTSVTVEIGNALSQVLTSSVTRTAITVVVPPCMVPGAVSVVARVGLARSETSATYQASQAPLQLGPGQYLAVDPVTLDGCATFPPAGEAGAEYLLAPQSVTSTLGLSTTFRLVGDSVVSVVTAPEPSGGARPFALAFHDFLRKQEAVLGNEPRVPYQPEPFLRAPQAGVDVGDSRTFKVCADIECSAVEDFETVTAEAKYVGDHAVVFVDRDAPTGLTEADLNALGVLFDRELYQVGTRAFGAESDVDRNGRVFILMSPVVNALTPLDQCPTSFITGFFFSLDTDPGRKQDVRSNQAEVFYSMVPDPAGTVTCDHSVDRVRRIVPITFIHEFQHLINFYQHVIRRAGTAEVTWLNEAMSHLAEELGAHHFRALGDSVRFSAFAVGDLFNAYQYLSSPEAHFVLFGDGTGTLEERGAGWLFLRWLVDQFGPDLSRRLSETGVSGATNVAEATGEPIAGLLSDWFLATFVSDLPDFSAPARLQYSTWDLRAVYESLHEQVPSQFSRPFPIVPWEFTGGTFDLTGTLRTGSGDYLRVVQTSNMAGFTVKLLDTGGSPLGGPAMPRLNVLRIR